MQESHACLEEATCTQALWARGLVDVSLDHSRPQQHIASGKHPTNTATHQQQSKNRQKSKMLDLAAASGLKNCKARDLHAAVPLLLCQLDRPVTRSRSSCVAWEKARTAVVSACRAILQQMHLLQGGGRRRRHCCGVFSSFFRGLRSGSKSKSINV